MRVPLPNRESPLENAHSPMGNPHWENTPELTGNKPWQKNPGFVCDVYVVLNTRI
jgi:hypothetical protein